MTCTWMITVPKGKFVKLKISSFFLEIFCNGPYLKIRDGQSESSDLLKSFCGRKFESSLFSSGRHLWVRFHSPNKKYLRGTGFNAVFEAVNQCELSYRVFSLTRISKISNKFCITIESNSQRTFSLLFFIPTWPPLRHVKTLHYVVFL